MKTEVRLYGTDRVEWSLSDSRQAPTMRVGQGKWGGDNVYLDLYPCYTHDPEIVTSTLEAVKAAFPLPDEISLLVAILPFEDLSRTNGATSSHMEREYGEGGKVESSQYLPTIRLLGKRIPPHPAMTRYLVAHEYGHVVDFWLGARDAEGKIDESNTQGFRKAYESLRGLDDDSKRPYGGGGWHASTGEIFANDFRLLITGIEPEFWPHPGTPRPEGIPALVEWWESHRP